MTDAIKCDRCMNFDLDDGNADLKIQKWKGRRSSAGYEDEDLCSDCKISLKKWFNGEEIPTL